MNKSNKPSKNNQLKQQQAEIERLKQQATEAKAKAAEAEAKSDKQAYSAGKKVGISEAKQLWESLKYECGKVDNFFQTVSDRTEAKKYNEDQYSVGYIEGSRKIANVVMTHCHNQCSKIGKFWGKEAAYVFCDVSKAIGRTASFSGLENIPSLICGEAYRIYCESQFINTATTKCPYYAKGDAFRRYYEANSNGVCSYNPNPK